MPLSLPMNARDVSETVLNIFSYIHTLTKDPRLDYELQFDAGIDQTRSDLMKDIFSAKKYDKKKPVEQLVRQTESKVRYDATHGKQPRLLDQKSTKARHDLALYAFHYDIRIDCCMETPLSGSATEGITSQWVIERLKRRTSYVPTDSNSFWKIDITEVLPRFKNPITGEVTIQPRVFELEFEMINEKMLEWLRAPSNEDDLRRRVTHLVTELYWLLKECIPYDLEHDSPVQEAPQILQQYYGSQIAKLTNTILELQLGPDEKKFGGSMPVSISRRNLEVVLTNPYYVTEKTDGIRYLLYVLNGTDDGKSSNSRPVAVLFSRGKITHLIRGSSELGDALKLNTILDGELVYDMKDKKTIFLVFDILAIDGRSVVKHLFSERNRILKDEISRRCLNIIQVSGGVEVTKILLKNFVPKKSLKTLIDSVSIEGLSKVYTDGRQRHKTDGFIFQPDLPYHPFIDHTLVKWKYHDMCTVDMFVRIETERLPNGEEVTRPKLFCSGPDQTLIDCSQRGNEYVGLGKFDTFRLLADCEDHNGATIAEMSYDTHVGTWIYYHLRKDKTKPNFIQTAMGVLIEQSEAISIEELEYSLLARNESENDFQSQLKHMKKEALKWQRDKTR